MADLSEPTPETSQATVEPGPLPPTLAACLACVFPLAGGLLFLHFEKKNAFVRFYAMQSIYFGGASVVAYVVIHVVWMILARVPFIGGLLSWIVSIVWVLAAVVWVGIYLMLIVKSITGREWEIPYLGQLSRAQSAQKLP